MSKPNRIHRENVASLAEQFGIDISKLDVLTLEALRDLIDDQIDIANGIGEHVR